MRCCRTQRSPARVRLAPSLERPAYGSIPSDPRRVAEVRATTLLPIVRLHQCRDSSGSEDDRLVESGWQSAEQASCGMPVDDALTTLRLACAFARVL